MMESRQSFTGRIYTDVRARFVTAGLAEAALVIIVPSLLLGTLVVFQPFSALVLCVPLVLGLLAVLAPVAPAVFLTLIVLLQPPLLRILPDTSNAWTVLKRLDEFSLAALLPLALLRLYQQGKKPLPTTTFLGLLAVSALGLFGSLLNHTPFHIVALDAFLLFKGFAAFVILSAFPPSPRILTGLIRVLVVFAVVVGLLGVLEVTSPDSFRTVLPLSRSGGYRHDVPCLVSVFDGAGQAGWFFAFMASGAFAFYLAKRSTFSLGLLLFFSLCAFLTLRRKPVGGIAAMLAVSLLLAYKPRLRARSVLALVATAVVCVVAFGDIFLPIFVEGYDTYLAPDDPYQVARNAMYLTSLQIAMDYFPLGAGFGLFGGYASQLFYSSVYYDYGLSGVWGLSPQFNRFMLDAFWPHVLGQFGFFGLVAFLLALLGVWLPHVRRCRTLAFGPATVLSCAAVLSFTEALVESTAESTFEGTLSSFFLFGLAAVASNATTHEA